MSATKQPYSLADLEQLQYDELQEQAVDEILETVLKNEDPSVQYHWSDGFDDSHGQTWVLFGNMAYELLSFRFAEKSEAQVEYVPLLVNGKMLREVPDEGKVGIAYLMRFTHWKGVERPGGNWLVGFMKLGWLHKDEIQMPKDQILNKLQSEVSLG